MPPDRFPATRHSAIIAARSDDPAVRRRAWETLIAAYWKPVYKYVRIRWRKSFDDAQDLTQGFFARSMEKRFFDSYDPAKASFRTFLRVCIDGYVANEEKSERAAKRGGSAQLLSLDFASAEGELRGFDPPDAISVEDYFHQEWVRSVFGLALESLRAECAARGREVHFRLFERYDIADEPQVTYERLASEFGLTVTGVTNYLAVARREFRRIVLEKLREITATDEEFRQEARLLLGVDSR